MFLYFVVKYCCDDKSNRCCRKLEAQLGNDLYWNSFIRFIYASFIEIVFGVAINYSQMQWGSWGCYYSNFHCFFFTPIIFVTPVAFGLYLWIYYEELHFRHYVRVVGTAYDDILLIENQYASLKPAIFLAHRQGIAMTLVWMSGAATMKCFLFIYSVLFYLIYICVVMPYRTYEGNKSEIFNLVCVYIICVHLLLFTDFVVDANHKYAWGYSIIGFLLFNVLWNLTWLMIHSIAGIIKQIKGYFLQLRGYLDGSTARNAAAKAIVDAEKKRVKKEKERILLRGTLRADPFEGLSERSDTTAKKERLVKHF
jgi:hypothetical protein